MPGTANHRSPVCGGDQCAFSDSFFTRVSIAIQFTSQVLPPSSENACSKRPESGVMSDQTFRTRMLLLLSVSWEKNSPRPFLNSPIVGGSSVPLALLEKLRLHWRDSGLYKRRPKLPGHRPRAPPDWRAHSKPFGRH